MFSAEDRQALARMFNQDRFPDDKSADSLGLSCNPNQLRFCKDSLISALLADGCLNCVDCMAQFKSADIFYCGEVSGLKNLPASAGINLYLALRNVSGSENYYQRLYLKDASENRIDEEIVDTKPDDWDCIVEWFKSNAREIRALQDNDTPENKLNLAKRYFIFSRMEDFKINASRYFYDKAVNYLTAVLPDCKFPSFSFSLSDNLLATSKSLYYWQTKYTEAQRSIAELFDDYNIQLSEALQESPEIDFPVVELVGLRRRNTAKLVEGYAQKPPLSSEWLAPSFVSGL